MKSVILCVVLAPGLEKKPSLGQSLGVISKTQGIREVKIVSFRQAHRHLCRCRANSLSRLWGAGLACILTVREGRLPCDESDFMEKTVPIHCRKS